MYDFMALLTGLIIAIMLSVNGSLTQWYGALGAAVIVHVAGVSAAWLLCRLQRTKMKTEPTKRLPAWLYLGGVIGVLTTLFNNLAYGHISVTSIIALGLLGQTVTSLVIDSRGLLSMEKHPVRPESLVCLAFSLTGILAMLDTSVKTASAAVLLSLAAGITVVLSRTVNARLAQSVGPLRGSFLNHLTGLPVALLMAVIMGSKIPVSALSAPLWTYLGGLLGVMTVMLCNIAVLRVSSFRMTLLTAVGQLLTGVLLDIFLKNAYMDASFIGGLLIAAGVLMNVIMEKYYEAKKRRNREYWAGIEQAEQKHRQRILSRSKTAEHSAGGEVEEN